ncbi:hypothetical protein [Endozoicomonas arenosclerae]|uniref:hypothetical protein n=1 Tax=Endozoicomonas arenosclerae TaxID=1633495 RepID=UPI0015616199|nr:hypothetical protein [Endozoicomonas arenosclerae]
MLPSLVLGECLDIRSYKRNRTIVICREDVTHYLLIENGFVQQDMKGSEAFILKALKKVVKKEFPRSNKLRIYREGVTDPYALSTLKRKTL